MRYGAIAVAVLIAFPTNGWARGRDLPADIAGEVEVLATVLDETLHTLLRPDVAAHEVRLVACDLRCQAIRCEFRNLPPEPAEKLTAWATRLEEFSPAECRRVCDELTDWLAGQRLRRQVRELLAAQDRIGDAILNLREEYTPHYDQAWGEPKLKALPLLVMKPGQKITVRQGIDWRQFPRDTIALAFMSGPAGLIVPADQKLNFDDHSTDFEYEIRATARGDYAIKLTPETGEPVIVNVSVR